VASGLDQAGTKRYERSRRCRGFTLVSFRVLFRNKHHFELWVGALLRTFLCKSESRSTGAIYIKRSYTPVRISSKQHTTLSAFCTRCCECRSNLWFRRLEASCVGHIRRVAHGLWVAEQYSFVWLGQVAIRRHVRQAPADVLVGENVGTVRRFRPRRGKNTSWMRGMHGIAYCTSIMSLSRVSILLSSPIQVSVRTVHACRD
jgi:hypothetical protein